MGVEQLISFYSSKAYEALGKQFNKVIADLCDMVMENARAALGSDYPDVAASLNAGLLSLAEKGLVDGQIGSDHWKAFMAEWGSGSLMDRDNPELANYMQSELWNPLRGSDLDITGRAQGVYLGLDGQMHESSGKLAGRSLEDMVEGIPAFAQWAEENLGPGAFQPKKPLHFMRDALESNRAKIIDQLNAVIEVFDFSAFFV